MGLIVVIGYLAMGENLKAIMGGCKASVGMLVLGIGTGGLISRFNHIING